MALNGLIIDNSVSHTLITITCFFCEIQVSVRMDVNRIRCATNTRMASLPVSARCVRILYSNRYVEMTDERTPIHSVCHPHLVVARLHQPRNWNNPRLALVVWFY